MSKKVALSLILILVLIGTGIGTAAAVRYYTHLPQKLSQHETIVLGQSRLVPGSEAALRVLVRDSANGAPLPDAEVQVALQPASGGQAVPLYTGRTDSQGNAAVKMKLPAALDPQQVLVVETRSSLGSDRLERPVTVERDYRVLLATDKPIYQPGQVIHLRALALSAFDLIPASEQTLEITIADGKGNKVFRQQLTTNEFGVTFTDFTLASEVNSGAYKINATLGNTSSEKTVTVEHYVLPKFEVQLETERSYYLPGERVRGTLQADYFFGKPVDNAIIKLEGYTFDFERQVTMTLEGVTDETGLMNFEFDLPTYITGSDLDSGLGTYYLQASVTDQAQHTEISNLSLPVAGSALVIEAVPEGGQFRQGVENILYVLTSYPNGAPAPARLQILFYDTNQTQTVNTGEFGLAEIKITPASPYQSIHIEATDETGQTAVREFYFEGTWAEETVLLRPDRPVYRVGESMNLTVLTSVPEGTVYLDILRDGQTLSTRSLPVENGQGQITVDLSPDMFGTLDLNAYKVLASGSIVRDTRVVVVDQADELAVAVNNDRDVYRPGDTASVELQVNGSGNQGVRSAVGLAVVDESVFALAEQDPGFARLYFLLEQELLVPKYDLHGFSVPDLMGGIPTNQPALREAVNQAAQASLSAVSLAGNPFSLQVNSHEDAMQRAYQRQQNFFKGMSTGFYILLLAVPLILLGITGAALIKEKVLGRSLLLVITAVVFLVIIFLAWPVNQQAPWIVSPLDKLSWMLSQITSQGSGILLILALVSVAGWMVLVVTAVNRKDLALGWLLLGIFVFLGVLVGLIAATSQASINPRTPILIAGIIAFVMLPFTFLLRSAGFFWANRGLAGTAALLLAVFLLVGTIPVLGMAARGPAMGAMDGVGGNMIVEEAAMEMPLPAMAPMPTAAPEMMRDEKSTENTGSGQTGAAQPPRLRQYFPETMLWLPDAITDETGGLTVEVPVADSITTWRMTVLASSQDGRIGSAVAGMRVFQDFFIDLDLPLALTVGDEVSIPVGVFNYLTEPQTVRLELEEAGWFDLLDDPVKEINIEANDISVVYFRIRAVDFGQQPFQVTATGSQMSDAIRKDVRVYPDGKLLTLTRSDRLIPGEPVQEQVILPAETIPGTQKLLVKVYPGILSQVVEGLDSILRMPYGCFEQTSSTTYPNVLVLDYLRTTSQAAPETELKAEEYINLGYQRLTTFEVSSGGFSLFGDAPADRMLTAYGLQEFSDMDKVTDVDPALIQRAAEWLLSQQATDGSWENDRGLVHENTWSSLGNDRLPVTAYIVWSLIDAGYGDDARTRKGLDYVMENSPQAEDAYVLALVANAAVADDLRSGGISDATRTLLDRLAGMARQEGSGAIWESGVATFMGSEGKTGSIETTALAALAFLRAGEHVDLANAALTSLIREKDSFGTWYSTQSTVLALKALIETVKSGAEDVDAQVNITLNGSQTRTLQVNRDNFDVVQLLVFDDINLGRANTIDIDVQGKGNLMYQVSGNYYLPWEDLAQYPELNPQDELVSIDVQYDRTELSVNDTVEVQVTVSLNEPGALAESALIDLGLPPGFSVEGEDLAALVASYNELPEEYEFASIQRYELTGRQILVYITNLSEGKPLTFTYRLRAKYPLRAQTPSNSVYDYYNPDVNGEQPPQLLVVN